MKENELKKWKGEHMTTHFAIDIDGTLGSRNEQQFLKTCNQKLKLNVSEERLAALSVATFLTLPELLTYKEHVGQAYFERAIGWVDFHPSVLRAMTLFDGAVEGVKKLAEIGEIAYYTARYVPEAEERNQQMAEATCAWLTEHQFPNPDRVIFCNGVLGKLQTLVQIIESTQKSVILIDDQYSRLIERLEEMEAQQKQTFCQHTRLIPYGTRKILQESSLVVGPLPSWLEIDMLLMALAEESCGARERR